jgi:glycosyltransferase involved in cell wall biosynthesis
MNILFISHFYHPHIGGVEKHTEGLSKLLLKEGHTITIITSKHDTTLDNYEVINTVKVYRILTPKIKLVGLLIIWLQMLKHVKLFIKADVVHAHDVFVWVLPIRLLQFSVPFTITLHGWEGKWPILRQNILLKQFTNKLSSGSLAIGNYISEYYRLTPSAVSYGATDIPAESITKKPKTILYVGRLSPDTGLPLFLKAAKDLKGYNIEFCGDGPLRQECEKIGTLHGFVDPQKYLIRSQYCIASGYLTILEALANKCIVFTFYDNPLKKDYFAQSPLQSVVQSSGSTNEFLIKFASLKKNKSKQKNLVTSGLKIARKHSWTKLRADYAKIHPIWQI